MRRYAIALLLATTAASAAEMPRLVTHDGRYQLLVDGKPFFILAAQLHNSSAWPAVVPNAFARAAALKPNTIEAPVYWEQFEPRPGIYDTTSVDALLAEARRTDKRLVLLWFGTWKNGQMHYVPEWMKSDPARYQRMLDTRGEPIDVMSPHAPANLEADKQAFAALMAHLRKVDGDRHTVILVQVENEPGSIGSVRDHGAAAEAAFAGPVPSAVLARTGRKPGSWRAVFGADADEAFAAWATASYIEGVAAAGKAAYPLPVYVNTWLRYKGYVKPGEQYPSGGATANVFDVWRAVTPSVDFIGTDIYTSDSTEYRKVLDQYARADNPSWVSETGFEAKIAPYLFYVLARGGIGFSVFGIDNDDPTADDKAAAAANAAAFGLIDPIREIVSQGMAERRLVAAVEEPGRARQSLDLGDGWRADLSFGPPPWGSAPAIVPNSPTGDGRVFLLRTAPDTWVVGGANVRVDLARDTGRGQLLRVEEGRFDDKGVWVTSRWLNGDETDYGLNIGKTPRLLRVRVGTF